MCDYDFGDGRTLDDSREFRHREASHGGVNMGRHV